MYTLSERAKLGLLGLLLLLMLVILAITALNTVQAVRSFQHQYSAVKAGDVSTIHPWMTIPVISHVYRVPEDYLYRSLNIDNPRLFRHATLYDIAHHKRQPVDQVIRIIQHIILAYRKEHHTILTPAPTPRSGSMKPLSPAPGRTK